MAIKRMPISIKAEAKNPTHLCANTGNHIINYDKSEAQGGTNTGPSPIHSFVATLNGCTYVLMNIVAKEMGIQIADVFIDAKTEFNPSQLMNLSDDKPIETIQLDVSLKTDATAEQLHKLEAEVLRRCPVGSIMVAAGIKIEENWVATPLEG